MKRTRHLIAAVVGCGVLALPDSSEGARKNKRKAWYGADSYSKIKTHPVAQKQPNAWGLYDMSGNVEEWVGDWYDIYTSLSSSDPLGPSSGRSRVHRGGGWFSFASLDRVGNRGSVDPGQRVDHLGFRLVRTIQE
jgi:formylglycine-generating enzyme required for sulfatase activity